MDVTQLRTLIHVAELGSLSKASERLHVAQPALSRQIRLLEEELGARLFERHGRGMVITDAGRDVLEHAGRIMAELDGIRGAIVQGRTSFRGTVTVGLPPTVSDLISVPLIRRMTEAHPRLVLSFRTAFSGYLLDWLQKGELDIAVSYNPQPLKSLRIEPVMTEDLLLVTAVPPAAGPQPFSILADRELVLPSPGHGLRNLLEDCARQAGIRLRTAVETDSFRVMTDLVQAGYGATVLPLAPIMPLVRAGTLSAVPLIDPAPVRKLVQVFAADRKINPAARFTAGIVRQIVAEMVQGGSWRGRMSGEGDKIYR